MAVDMFLKLDGIPGESIDKKHKDTVDVLAWSWGISQSGTTHMGKGGGSGKASFQDLSLTKYVDKASTLLMNCVATGKHIAKAKLTVRKAGGDDPLEYIVMDLEDVIVSSLSTGGSGGEDRLTENISLNFAKIKTTYIPQDTTGAGMAAVEFGYNIPENSVA